MIKCLAMCNSVCIFRCFGSLYNIVTRASSHYQPPTQPRPAYMPLKDTRRAKCYQCPTRTPQSRQSQLERKRDQRMDTVRNAVPCICPQSVLQLYRVLEIKAKMRIRQDCRKSTPSYSLTPSAPICQKLPRRLCCQMSCTCPYCGC